MGQDTKAPVVSVALLNRQHVGRAHTALGQQAKHTETARVSDNTHKCMSKGKQLGTLGQMLEKPFGDR